MEFLRPGEGLCPSKLGEKRIYDLVVGDKVLKGGAWSYEEELAPKAERFRGMIGFLDEAPLMLILKKLPLTYGMLLNSAGLLLQNANMSICSSCSAKPTNRDYPRRRRGRRWMTLVFLAR
jgi:hypothetical protein